MPNNRKKIIFAFMVVFLLSTFYFLFSNSVVSAAEPTKLTYEFLCSGLPGTTCPGSAETAQSPAAYIARFYQFALMLAGMLAFGMIIFGAIQYIVSAGNPTAQSDARDRIFQALWGVALLLGAYLILYTIDPKLVNLTDPNINLITNTEPSPTKTLGVEGSSCKNTADCDYGLGFVCQDGTCVLGEKRKQAQQSGNYQWVNFGDPQIRARYGDECSGMGKIRYVDTYCPGSKPGDNYQCCGG